MFEHRLQVRFHQADPAGVLFYGRLFELVEEVYEAFCRASGIDIDALMRGESVTTPVIHAEADYVAPMPVGEVLTARVAVTRIGESSFTLEMSFTGADSVVRSVARVVHVYVDASTWEKVPIPADARRALQAHASET